MLKKLKIQFVCITMSIVTVMLCVIFGLVYHFTSVDLEAKSLESMRKAVSGHKPPENGRPPKGSLLPFFSVCMNPDGSWYVSECSFFDVSDEALVESVIQEALTSDRQHGRIQGQNLRFMKSVNFSDLCIIFADTSMETAVLANLIRSSLAIGVLCLVVFLGISMGLAFVVAKPIEQAWVQQKQFVADASHELKTPLTVILTNAELLQSPGYSEIARKQFAENILTMSHQMRGLVEGLLNLARVDNGTGQVHFSVLNFSQLVTNAMLTFEAVFFESGLELSGQVTPDIYLRGSKSHLEQVMDVLLDNARKYSAPKGTVLVRLVRQGHSCLLSVSNPGDAISQEDLKNIFKRFYRVDKTRSRNSSYGLGLPIALGNVELHRGKIWAGSSEGINTFWVQLPTTNKSSEEG